MNQTVVILNWDKYCPRKDLKSTSWLRLSNNLFEDPDFYELDHSELCFWIYLLCQASKKQSGEVRVNLAHAERIGRFKKSVALAALEKLQQLRCVQLTEQEANADVTCTTRARHADVTLRTERNEHNVTNITNITNAATSGVPPVIATLADPLTLELLGKVKTSIQESWIQLYGDAEFVKREIQQAAVWCQANAARRPKSDYGRFLTKWLARGWERHRKSIPANPALSAAAFDHLKPGGA